MRKITKQACEAFTNNGSFKGSNTLVNDSSSSLRAISGYKDFVIALNGGAVSSKEIMLNRDGKKVTFLINNCIDGSEQELSERSIMNSKYTNIGTAMTLGAFYQVI